MEILETLLAVASLHVTLNVEDTFHYTMKKRYGIYRGK